MVMGGFAGMSCVLGGFVLAIDVLMIWPAKSSSYHFFHSAEESAMLVAIAIWVSIVGWCAALFGYEVEV